VNAISTKEGDHQKILIFPPPQFKTVVVVSDQDPKAGTTIRQPKSQKSKSSEGIMF